MVKVMLADDHKIIRDGIKALLKDDPEIEVVAEASNGREVIDGLPSCNADVVLMDLNMPEMDGVEATRLLKENFSTTKVLILSMLNENQQIKQMLEMGASGYILKASGEEDLVNAIKTVAAGRTYISPDIAINLLNKIDTVASPAVKEKPEKGAEVSKRELEVLKLIAEGLTNGQIADKLFTSKRTIESHRRNLIEKTKTKNTAELINYSIKNGLL